MAQATYQDYIKAIASWIPAGRIYTDRVLQKAGYGILFPAEMKNLCCGTSPCIYRMRKVMTEKLKLYEPVEFVHEFLLDKLKFTRKKETVAIHSTCSTKKLGLTPFLEKVAGLCAEKVVLPPDVSCCGFAGDKGFHLPDMNRHGLRKAVPVIQQAGATVGYSNSRTCEIGCAIYTGIPYMSIMYLVDETTQPRT